MRIAVTLLRKAGYSAAVASLVAFSTSAPAAPIALSDTPLFLAAGVQPNLIMAIDDSGSMDNETLFPGNDGAAWWRRASSDDCTSSTDNHSFIGCITDSDGTRDIPTTGRLNFNSDGTANNTWKKYTYLFPNGSGGNRSARRRAGDGANDHFAIPPLQSYAWARSPTVNRAYFDPRIPYTPWVSIAGEAAYTFNNASYTAAPFDPVFEPTVTINLTQEIAGNGNTPVGTACDAIATNRADNWYFKVYQGMELPQGTCIRVAQEPDLPNDGNSDPEEAAPEWQEVRAEGCSVAVTNDCYTVRGTTNRQFTLPDGARVAIRYFPATFYLPATVNLGAAYGYTAEPITGATAPDGTALKGYEIKPGNFEGGADGEKYQAAIQNFANWFTYYRKRHQALRAGLGKAFDGLAGMRVDGFTINNSNVDVTMRSIDNTTARTALYKKFYYDWVNSGGTPNRTAVASIIENFQRTDADKPIISACQKNFGMLFTDGFSNAPASGDGIDVGNADSGAGRPYADSTSNTLADAVYEAYTNLLDNNGGFERDAVSIPNACETTPTPNSLDCNNDLHMNFYAVTLGTRGLLFDPDTTQDPYAGTTGPAWPSSFPTRHPSAVDDLWHATINGRGQLLNARTPTEISTKLRSVLDSIIGQTSSAAAASVNSGSVSSTTRVFQATFRSDTWTGELQAFRVNQETGALEGTTNRDDVWAASEKLRGMDPAARKIYTRNTAGQPVRFEWSEISSDATLVANFGATAAEQQIMVNYLRGSNANEIPRAGGTLRRRANPDGSRNILGDIVSSAPLFVGAPPFRYRDSLERLDDGDQPDTEDQTSYSKFARDKATRQGMVYVGANDGMLHAFYADGPREGEERFAYIPTSVIPRLKNLAAADYGHEYFVDGSPSMGDAYFTRAGRTGWHTVLVGGLNKGGQGIYALDITDPAAFDTAGTDKVMWEFTDANDADLGYTYSQPTIVRLRNGKWAAVFGNGYNSRQPSSPSDNRVSTTGNAVLFIVDLATGALIRKLDTGVGYTVGKPASVDYDNGLATPSLVDIDGDRIVDYAYAGDLYGNMWKFDLTGPTDASWNVAFGGNPLFTARDANNNVQPITVRPEIARGPLGNGVVVLFGTGKYLEANDRQINLTPQVTHSFYGIVDRGTRITATGSTRSTALTRQRILVEHQIDTNGSEAGGVFDARVTSNNTLGSNSGWYLDLQSPKVPVTYEGERQVTNPIVRNGAVIFTTLIPDRSPCGAGGRSWLMELDLLDGSRLEVSPFDLNRDGDFDNDDKANNVTVDDGTGAPTYSGLSGGTSQGIQAAPGVLQGELGPTGRGKPVQYKYLTGTAGKVQIVIENPGLGGTGRQSWRQVR